VAIRSSIAAAIAAAAAAVAASGLLVAPATAGIPAGGMDVFADYWIDEGVHGGGGRHHHHGAPFFLGGGPFRLSLSGLQIGNIANNTRTVGAPTFVVAMERLVQGPFLAGGSFGFGNSDDLRWTHGEAHVGMLMNDRVSVRIGLNSDRYEYLTNQTAATNVARNLLQGLELGADVFGSPRPGWFVQLSGELLPLDTIRTDGSRANATTITARGTAMLGFTIWPNFDFTVLVVAVPGLGDSKTTGAHLGASLSVTL
jgi:hypothetical protein